MPLRLYDTEAAAVRDFEPLRPGAASIYLCGATVQAPPHIGHLRSGVALARALARALAGAAEQSAPAGDTSTD